MEAEKAHSSLSSRLVKEEQREISAIGGRIVLGAGQENPSLTYDKIVIRCDGGKLTLPVQDWEEHTQNYHKIQETAYKWHTDSSVNSRRPLFLDESSFCTNFDPSHAGILDVIAQVFQHERHRGVRAKLNRLEVKSIVPSCYGRRGPLVVLTR